MWATNPKWDKTVGIEKPNVTYRINATVQEDFKFSKPKLQLNQFNKGTHWDILSNT